MAKFDILLAVERPTATRNTEPASMPITTKYHVLDTYGNAKATHASSYRKAAEQSGLTGRLTVHAHGGRRWTITR